MDRRCNLVTNFKWVENTAMAHFLPPVDLEEHSEEMYDQTKGSTLFFLPAITTTRSQCDPEVASRARGHIVHQELVSG